MKKKIFSFFVTLLFLLPLIFVAQTPPEKFLGHKVGADRRLVDYKQIMAYFQKLDEESERIKVLTIGKTTLNKPMIMAVISSEENMAKLDTYRGITKKLRDAKDLTADEAMRLSQEGKAIVLMTLNIHATEIASSQMAMELAYILATGKTSFVDVDKVLKDVIVLLAPSINPDGQQMVTDWYKKYVGTKYEGGSMPWLYHHYAGHDTCRDYMIFNLDETKAVGKVVYHDWIPQIHIDQHQMGSTGARLWVPPFRDPPSPTVHPLLWRGIALCGTNIAYDLQKNDFKGVVYGRNFAGWWIGASQDTSWFHNCIGLLSEMASVKIATPIYIDPTEIPKSYIEKRMQFPDPWPGGWWRLRDIVEYELALSMSLIKTAYLYKEDLLFNIYKMCKDSIQKREEGQPFAFIIPKKQWDYPTSLRMLDALMFGGAEIHQAKENFTAEGKSYPADSFVVLMSQPYRPYVQAFLERQKYPDLRLSPDGPIIPPYDNAGWTIPLLMGVKCDQIDHPFKANLTKLVEIPYPTIMPPKDSASYIVLDSRVNASFAAVFSLIKEEAEIYRSKDVIKGNEFETAAGSFIIKNTPRVQKTLTDLLEKWHLKTYELQSIIDIPKAPLKKHRIGLYQSWRPNMDEGWTRFVFDDLGVPYTTLHNKDFKGTKKKKISLKEKFDVIVFADEDIEIIKSGKRSSASARARSAAGFPPEYEGGIGNEGIQVLKSFVEKGGILVTLNNACGLALKEFKVPVTNVLDRVERSKFFCPTSILKVKVNNKSPIGYGMAKEATVMFSRGLALSTMVPSGEYDREVVAIYPQENILLSGWIRGEDVIARKAAVVDLKYKRGHIILIGIRCQHRAQSHGTYKFLLNALLYPDID